MDEIACQIIENCPDFMYGCCQKYLDGDCSAHKCDLKIIRELEQKLQAKEQEREELKKQLEQQEALTETYKTCYRAKHNDVKDELTRLKQALDEIENYCKECNLKADFTACDILQIIEGKDNV